MWTETTLGEACKMYQPKTISAKEMQPDGKYVVYGANGVIGRYDQYNHAEPQLLVTCRGATCGSVNVSQPFSWITGNAMVIQPDPTKISLRFMEYLCRGGIDLTGAITGAAQPQITRQSLVPIKFSYPLLAEQVRIVAKLDAAFAEIDRAIELTDEREVSLANLKSAVLSNALTDVGWQAVQLGDLFTVGSSKRVLKAEWKSSGVPFYRGREITALSKNGAVKNELFIEEKHFNILAKKYGTPKSGDIMITAIGTIGNCYIVREGDRFYFKDASVLWLQRKTDINSKYVWFWLHSGAFKRQLDVGNGATVDTLTIKKLASMDIKLPSLSDQQLIVKKLDAMIAEIDNEVEFTKDRYLSFKSLKSAILAQELRSEDV